MDEKKRKISFPHMGTISYAWSAALRIIGCEPYIEPYTSKKALSLGTKHAPEAICLPYKLILGNFIEAIEGGADYVAMITSPGICRLGEYGGNIYSTLKDLGYNLFDINSPFYQDICTPYKSSNGTDVLLSDRVDYYYNNNETLCQSNCQFSHYSEQLIFWKALERYLANGNVKGIGKAMVESFAKESISLR